MQFVSLASGSKGNCYYFASEEGTFLVDCGISMKRVEAVVNQLAFGGMQALKGIFITHEHRDHIAGLGPILRRYHLPCYGTEATLDALDDCGIGKVDHQLFRPLSEGPVEMADFSVSWSRISHDAADPVSYQIRWRDRKIGMLTDAGVLSDDNMEALYDSDLLLLEANHDVDMLRNGPYPQYLKQRIYGKLGHLSNDYCANAVSSLITGHTGHVVLAHLSEKNNLPRRAYQAVQERLVDTLPTPEQVKLWVASQKTPLSITLSEGKR